MKNPLQYSFKTEIWPLAILAATVAVSAWSYPHLPNQVVTHWNIQGQANGWSSRTFQAIFFPALLAAMYALFSLMPLFDPRRERYQEFAKVYRSMRNLILSALLIIFTAATFSNLGYAINIGVVVAGTIGLMFALIGAYLPKLKRNWFIGIRTPWTLSSENVWDKTHRLGGRLFIVLGIAFLVSPWLAPAWDMIIIVGGLLAFIAAVGIYSYVLYKREKTGGRTEKNN